MAADIPEPLPFSQQHSRPMISVLLGPSAAGIGEWKRGCTSQGRPTAIATGIDPHHWMDVFVATFLRQGDPQQIATTYLTVRLPHRDVPLDLSSCTLRQLEMLCEQAGLADHGSDRLCRSVLNAAVQQNAVTAQDICRWLQGMESAEELPTIVLPAIVGLYRPGESPALLILPASPSDGRDVAVDEEVTALAQAGRQLTGLLTEVPALSAGLCVSHAVFERYLQETPESFAKAVLRESVRSIQGMTADEITEMLAHRSSQPTTRYQQQIEQLAARGASRELAARFVDAIVEQEQARLPPAASPAVPPPANFTETAQASETSSSTDSVSPTVSETESAVDAETGARSAAELFLYTILEETLDLAGLFALNGRLDFVFGNQPAEIDLLCVEHRIAVEIDGYHHFTNPAAYRRDRRKDALLQHHRYFVLRFLAEDVVSEIESIFATIRSAIRSQT